MLNLVSTLNDPTKAFLILIVGKSSKKRAAESTLLMAVDELTAIESCCLSAMISLFKAVIDLSSFWIGLILMGVNSCLSRTFFADLGLLVSVKMTIYWASSLIWL